MRGAADGRARRHASASGSENEDDGFGPARSEKEGDAQDRGSTAFIDRLPAQVFFGLMVIANAVFIGFEVQVRASNRGGGSGMIMVVMEGVFFLVFFIELIMRVLADRCPKFVNSTWNLIDLVLVVASGVDLLFQLTFPADEEGATKDMGKLRAIRLLKITRLVRLVRVFRVFRFRAVLRATRGLIILLIAIVKSISSLGWVAFMMGGATYLFAIVTTEFIGLSNDDGDADIEMWFGDMVKSMFTLIQLSTLEAHPRRSRGAFFVDQGWSEIARTVGSKHGAHWMMLILVYVLFTNLIILNTVLASLIGSVIELNAEVKGAHSGVGGEDAPSWMKTPSSLDGDEDLDDGDDKPKASKSDGTAAGAVGAAGSAGGAGVALAGAGMGVVQQTVADRLTTQTLNEFFDLASTYVGIEGVNQRRVVTEESLGETLLRVDVRDKLLQACPAFAHCEPEEICEKIWQACPQRLDQDGMSRQELAEAVLTLRGELSMNHFVLISQALQKLEKHIDHELTHLNKHQRKLNRRFLKLRHRLRKVYHFDGAPRKMVEMMNEMKRKTIAAAAEASLRGDPTPMQVLQQRKDETGDAGSSEVDLSEDTSDSEAGADTKW